MTDPGPSSQSVLSDWEEASWTLRPSASHHTPKPKPQVFFWACEALEAGVFSGLAVQCSLRIFLPGSENNLGPVACIMI